MKVVLSDGDKRYIDWLNERLAAGKETPIITDQVGGTYFINFTCTDAAKANCFVLNLLENSEEARKNLEENCGIKINSINFCEGDNKVAALKENLREFLAKLEALY